jgi:hypothetical protein
MKTFKQLLAEEINNINNADPTKVLAQIDEALSDLDGQGEMISAVASIMASKNAPSESVTELINIFKAYSKALNQIKDFIK